MHFKIISSGRTGQKPSRGICAALAVLLTSGLAAGEARAQELVHRFINPSFGGNPFNSDHLLSIATIHRPKEPKEATKAPSQEESIANTLRGRILGNLSDDILDQILEAKPGDSGNFELGDQRISYTRTTTETRVTFFNSRTGETTNFVIPDETKSASSLVSQNAPSAEQMLSAPGSVRSGLDLGGSLAPAPLSPAPGSPFIGSAMAPPGL